MKLYYKAFSLLSIFLITTGSLFSQARDGINYQAVIRNADGSLNKNSNVDFRFTVRNSGGATMYSETKTLTTDDFGGVTHVIGTGTQTSGSSYANINWYTTFDRSLLVEMRVNGSYTQIANDRLNSVPFALYAKEAARVANPVWSSSGTSIRYTSGNVGIGASTPLAPLEIRTENSNNTPQTNGLLVRSVGSASTNNAIVTIQTDAATAGDPRTIFNINGVRGYSVGIDNSDADKFKISGSAADLTTLTRLTIVDNGDIGIGTTSPTERLDVQGGNININTGDLYAAQTNGVINVGGGIMSPLLNVIADNFTSASNVSGDEDLYIQDDLQVNSQAYKPGGGSFATTSDRRLKKEIKPFTDGLNELLQINTVTFKYNDARLTSDINKAYVGIIAQEMQKVAPYTVEEQAMFTVVKEDSLGNEIVIDPGQRYLTFDPSALTYITINAVQEQQVIITELKTKLDQAEEANRALEARLEAIEALLETKE